MCLKAIFYKRLTCLFFNNFNKEIFLIYANIIIIGYKCQTKSIAFAKDLLKKSVTYTILHKDFIASYLIIIIFGDCHCCLIIKEFKMLVVAHMVQKLR